MRQDERMCVRNVRARLALRALVFCIELLACDDRETKARAMTGGGEPARGRVELREHGCGACHTIPGVPGAHALVGPPLDHMAVRAYIAGVLPNTPENLRAWIAHPQSIKPGSKMPDFAMLPEQDIAGIAAWLKGLE